MNNLKQYAKYYKRLKAYEKICADLKPAVLRELKKEDGGKACILGVDFHITNKAIRRYPKDVQAILNNLKSDMEIQKKLAEDAGKVTITHTETFDASIAEATEQTVLSEVSDYARYFGSNND